MLNESDSMEEDGGAVPGAIAGDDSESVLSTGVDMKTYLYTKLYLKFSKGPQQNNGDVVRRE